MSIFVQTAIRFLREHRRSLIPKGALNGSRRSTRRKTSSSRRGHTRDPASLRGRVSLFLCVRAESESKGNGAMEPVLLKKWEVLATRYDELTNQLMDPSMMMSQPSQLHKVNKERTD